MLILLSSPLRSSFTSTVFDFSTSPIDVASVPNVVPCYYSDNYKKVDCWWMPFVCCFILSLQSRSSSVSVVFDFNASLRDVTPVSPMMLSVYLMRMEKSELLMDAICVLFFFLFTTQVELSECCV